MHLIRPSGDRQVWTPRFKNWDGHLVSVPGCRNKNDARRRGERCLLLVNSKHNGDPPPVELSKWLANMEDDLYQRLLKLGLIDRRRREQVKPIAEHIVQYQKAVLARKSNTAAHAKQMAANVKNICEGLNIETYSEIQHHDIAVWLNERGSAPRTQEYYLTSMGDFCKWMLRTKRATENRMEGASKPSGQKDEEYERRPLTVKEFRRLMAYLDTFERYENQQVAWTAHDRKMIYWTAVCTGYRQNELRSLKRANLFLDESPATIDIKAKNAKNRTAGSVPIPTELALELNKYTAQMHPASSAFPIPIQRNTVSRFFKLDLKGAEIEREWETGEVVDFHALRTTAICWWLDEYGLSQKRVQILARLKTLRLVERYSRKLRLSADTSWLSNAPSIADAGHASNQSA